MIEKRYKCSSIDTNKIFLMMGFDCNFSCRHCIQNNCSSNKIQKNINTKVINYINDLISIRPDSFPKLTLVFWGGEPLLYIDIIKKIINIYNDKLRYSIITNGSLLTDELVEYINDNDIYITLSYDGKNTDKVRNINILEDKNILDLFLKIKNKSICSILSAYNYDIQELFEDIENKIGKDIPISIEPFKITWDMPKDLYTFDLTDYQTKLHNLAKKALNDILFTNTSREAMFFYSYLSKLCKKENKKLNCGQMYNVMNIDLDGNVYNCHNCSSIVGTVDEIKLELCKKQDEWVDKNKPLKCDNCEFKNICNYGCPNDIIIDGERATCKINKILFKEVFWLANEIENSFLDIDLEE